MSPTAEATRRQLERLLASEVFTGSTRLSRFLSFVVETALDGDGDRLKEYVIGIEVFDRDSAYDPRLDSIVRVEAGRLRTKLAEYYGGEGRGDPVTIRIEKGGYAPLFEFRTNGSDKGEPLSVVSLPSAAAPRRPEAPRRALVRRAGLGLAAVLAIVLVAGVWRAERRAATASLPRIAVLPFTPYAEDPDARALAEQLRDGVTAEFVRSAALRVAASMSSARFDGVRASALEAALALDADVLLEARLFAEAGRLHVEARLVDGAYDEKFWVESFVGSRADLDDLERRVASAAIAAISIRTRAD